MLQQAVQHEQRITRGARHYHRMEAGMLVADEVVFPASPARAVDDLWIARGRFDVARVDKAWTDLKPKPLTESPSRIRMFDTRLRTATDPHLNK